MNFRIHSSARRVEDVHLSLLLGSTRPVLGSLPVDGATSQGLAVRLSYGPRPVLTPEHVKLELLQGVPTQRCTCDAMK